MGAGGAAGGRTDTTSRKPLVPNPWTETCSDPAEMEEPQTRWQHRHEGSLLVSVQGHKLIAEPLCKSQSCRAPVSVHAVPSVQHGAVSTQAMSLWAQPELESTAPW